MRNLVQEGLPVAAVKDRPQRQELVQRRPERIHIRALIDQDPLRAGLFGAHVTQCAEQVSALGNSGPGMKLRQAEIGKPNVAAVIDEQIGWLHVPVDDAHRVGVFQRFRSLNTDSRHGAEKIAGVQRMVGGLRDGCRAVDEE